MKTEAKSASADGRGKVLKLVIAAMFAAVVAVATMVIQVPTQSGGYINLGDCFVILSAWMLGPVWGAAAAGIGAGLADVISGYAMYAPATLVIKAAMAVAAYFIMAGAAKKTVSVKIAVSVVAAVAAELIMAVGYLAYDSILYGVAAGVSGIPGNVIQGLMGLAAAVVVASILRARPIAGRIKSMLDESVI